jgi:hypothetical protein
VTSLKKSALTLACAQSRLSGHPDFWLTIRDRRSNAISCDPIVVTTLLCPGFALMLKDRLQLNQPTDDVLVLDRIGNEAKQARWGEVRKTHDAAEVLQRLAHCDTES